MPTTRHALVSLLDITASVYRALLDHEQAHGRMTISPGYNLADSNSLPKAKIRISRELLERWIEQLRNCTYLIRQGDQLMFNNHCMVGVDNDAADSVIVDEMDKAVE